MIEHLEWLPVALAGVADAVLVADASGQVTYLNNAAAALTGWRVDEAEGQPLDRVLPLLDENERPLSEAPAARALRERRKAALDVALLRARGGPVKRVKVSAAPFHDGRDKPIGVVLVCRPLREQQRQVAELTERVRLAEFDKDIGLALTCGDGLRSVLQSCAEAMVRHLDAAFARVWTVGPREDVLELQASAGRYTHLDGPHSRIPVGEFKIGRIARERRPHLTNQVVGDPRIHDQEWARREGMVAFAGYPLVVDDKLVGVVALFARRPLAENVLQALASVANGIALGIERKRAEERLRDEVRVTETLNRLGNRLAAELDLRKLLQAVTDESTRLTGAEIGAFFFNAHREDGEAYTLYTLSGVAPEAFARFPMPRNTAIFAPTFRGEATLRLDDVTQDARYGQNAPHRGMPDGHIPVRSYLAVPVVSNSGEVLGGLFFGHSLPGRFRERDEQLVAGLAAHAAVAIDNARLFQEARALGEELRERNQELAAAARRKDEFLSMLAHELRNPLAPIRNGLHVLKLAQADRQAVEKVRVIMERQIKHMTQLVDDLLEVSRLTRGKIVLRPAQLDLARLARDSVEDHRAAFEREGLQLAVHAPETPVWVMGDGNRLMQVLDNLLQNALKFTDRGGRVDVLVGSEDDRAQAVLAVRDTGVGIAAELLPRLFGTFAQAEQGLDRSKGGLGLGLTLVKGLVELHGGRVEAASAGLGRGATFTVQLPSRPEPAALTKMPLAPRRAARRLRVLVVEDNHDSADSLRMLLEHFGHEVTVAYSGPDGVRAAAALRPDVVICDIGLPGMDGYHVAGELKRNPATASARVIAVTGYGQEADRRKSQEAGFDLHLTKPVDPDALLQLVGNPSERSDVTSDE